MTDLHLKLRKPSPKWLGPAEKLYCDAFPAEERRPFDHFLLEPDDKLRGPYLHIILLSKGITDKFAGLLTTWQFDDFVYIEHLATMPGLRGSGIGTSVIEGLRGRVGCPLVLEAEHPSADNPMAARRLAFYDRLGFDVIDSGYIQPPYGPGLPEVPLRLLADSTDLDAAEVARTLHREVYGVTC